MNEDAEEFKEPLEEISTPLVTIGDFSKIKQTADAFFNIAKLAGRKMTPGEKSKAITSLIVNLLSFVMDIAGSDDAYDEIIIQAKDILLQPQPEPELKS